MKKENESLLKKIYRKSGIIALALWLSASALAYIESIVPKSIKIVFTGLESICLVSSFGLIFITIYKKKEEAKKKQIEKKSIFDNTALWLLLIKIAGLILVGVLIYLFFTSLKNMDTSGCY